MFKEVPNERVLRGFGRAAARVRNATGAKAVYEERAHGVLSPPQLASAFFSRPIHVVWMFGRSDAERVPPRLETLGRDGR